MNNTSYKSIILLLIISYLFTPKLSFAQVELKRKQLEQRLIDIQILLSSEKFEQAIELFNDEKEVILEKNVKKKQKMTYFSVKDKVNLYQNILNESHYKIDNWDYLYNNQDYESLLNSFHELKINHIYKDEVAKYASINDFLFEWKKSYNRIKRNHITDNQEILNKWYSNESQYEEAKMDLEDINQRIAYFDHITLPKGNIPQLKSEISKTKELLIAKQETLKSFIVDSKPLNTNEIKSLICSSRASIKDFEKYCTEIQYSGSSMISDLVELRSILDLDVIRYYNLSAEYSSELKIKRFKNSTRYKNLLSKLKTKRAKIINNKIFLNTPLHCDLHYDIKSKGFIRELDFLHGNGYKPESYLQFDDVCILKPQDFKMKIFHFKGLSDYFTRQEYYVPVKSENIAMSIEDNCRNISIGYVLDFQKLGYRKGLFNQSYKLAIVCNVIQYVIYNNKTGQILYRKVY